MSDSSRLSTAPPSPRPARSGAKERPREKGAQSDAATKPRWTRLSPTTLSRDIMLEQLDRRDRLRLVEFVCSFAWADFEIKPEERVFISRLIRKLDLDEEEDLKVQQWLDRPPRLDGLDPTVIPQAHRQLFVDAIEGLIAADGEVSDEERDSFEIFKQLVDD